MLRCSGTTPRQLALPDMRLGDRCTAADVRRGRTACRGVLREGAAYPDWQPSGPTTAGGESGIS